MQDWPGLISQANSRRWRSHRRSVCLRLANLPTVAETLPGFVAVGWQCVVAPIGTPQEIVRKISDDLRAVLVKPEIKDKLAARGGYVHPANPAEAEAFVRSQQELWKPALEQVALQFKKK